MRFPLCALFTVLAVLARGPALDAQNTTSRNFRVTLLGTGSPALSVTRFGPSILVEAGDQMLVFDAGRGAAQRLAQLDVSLDRIDAVFLTHLHSDHVVGLPDLWLSGWILTRRSRPWELLGPTGTEAMAAHLAQAFAFDIDIRIKDGRQDPRGARLAARDIQPGVVYERGGVKVTAFLVDHGLVAPAFGYRVDYDRRTVVLSGDTRFSPDLIAIARGADLLVHEVALAPVDVNPSAPYYRAFAHHTTPEQAAEVFTRARPALAVYSHIVVFGDSEESAIIDRTRRGYAGPVLLGHDLMSVAVGDTLATPRPRAAAVAPRP
ncbi:MAG TPA: MBL fold metallo-hydrolase [Gemmatimonadaceae bacterium]|jgi:ribonuclease Z